MKQSNKKIKGRVLWFDPTSGEGMVQAESGEAYYLHFTCVVGLQKNGYAYPAAKDKAKLPQPGWSVDFTLYRSANRAQVGRLWVKTKTKPRKRPSIFLDREAMKQKLVAVKAQFSESFPDDGGAVDELHTLLRKQKLTKREEAKLKKLEQQVEEHYQRVREHNRERSLVICSIYKEHNRFELLKGGAA